MKKEENKEVKNDDEKYQEVKETVMTSEISLDELLEQLDDDKDHQ